MNKVILLTKTDKIVAKVDMNLNPALEIMCQRGTEPDVIMWGSRFFVKHNINIVYAVGSNPETWFEYQEAFLMTVF